MAGDGGSYTRNQPCTGLAPFHYPNPPALPAHSHSHPPTHPPRYAASSKPVAFFQESNRVMLQAPTEAGPRVYW